MGREHHSDDSGTPTKVEASSSDAMEPRAPARRRPWVPPAVTTESVTETAGKTPYFTESGGFGGGPPS